MRLLLLTPRDPYGEVGGDTLRTRKIIDALKNDHEVQVITFGKCSSTSLNDGVTTITVRHTLLDRFKGAANAALRGESWQLGYYWNASFLQTVLNEEARADAAIIHLIRLYDYGKYISKPTVFELTDCISRNHREIQILSWPFSFKKLLFKLDSRRLAAQEVECTSRYTSVFISDFDRVSAATRGDRNSYVIPNGVDFPETSGLTVKPSRDVLFIGNLRSEMNFDGLKSFVKSNQDYLRENRIKVRVIGSIPRSRSRYMNSSPLIISHGFVADIGEVAEKCCAGIAPILNGAGQQNKILDYIAYKLPIFTTPLAFSAYEPHGINAYVTSNLRDFPKFYESLADSKTKKATDANLSLAKDIFTWEAFKNSYRKIFAHAD